MKINPITNSFGVKSVSGKNSRCANFVSGVKKFAKIKGSEHEYTKLGGFIGIGVGVVGIAVSKIFIVPAVLFAGICTLGGSNIDYQNSLINKNSETKK